MGAVYFKFAFPRPPLKSLSTHHGGPLELLCSVPHCKELKSVEPRAIDLMKIDQPVIVLIILSENMCHTEFIRLEFG